jgi:hypothetical protein
MPIEILRELNALASDRPGLDTTAEFAATWFAAKARLHEHLAAEPDHDSAWEAALASWAYERSRQLLRSTPRTGVRTVDEQATSGTTPASLTAQATVQTPLSDTR